MQSGLKTLAAVAVVTFSLSAFASSENCTKEPKSKWMAKKDVSAKLVAQGMKVNRIKTEGSCYESYVIDKGWHCRLHSFKYRLLCRNGMMK